LDASSKNHFKKEKYFINVTVLYEAPNSNINYKKRDNIMKFNLIDKSNYFRGLLILIRKNETLTESTSRKVKRIATVLEFNQDFVDSSVKNLLVNKNIVEEPPKFSDYRLAESFIKDGIRLAFSDGNINLLQIQWLANTAQKNNLSKQWFFMELEDFIDRYELNSEMIFEIKKRERKSVN